MADENQTEEHGLGIVPGLCVPIWNLHGSGDLRYLLLLRSPSAQEV